MVGELFPEHIHVLGHLLSKVLEFRIHLLVGLCGASGRIDAPLALALLPAIVDEGLYS